MSTQSSPLLQAASVDELLGALVEAIDDHALLVLDAAGRIAEWSAAAERLTGYTRQEAVGRHVSILYTAEELRDGVVEREVRGGASGRVRGEGWWMRKDGARLWGRRTLYPLRAACGGLLGVGVLVCDLTDRRERQRRAEEREECFRSLFEHNSDAVCALDVRGTVTGANAALEALTGYRSADLLAHPFHALVEPEHRDGVSEALALASRGEAQATGFALRRRDGRRLELDATFVPIFLGTKTAGVFVVSRDVTERRRSEALLRAREERFRMLLEGSTEGFFYTLDAGGRFRYLSPSVHGVTGRSPEELLGRGFEALSSNGGAHSAAPRTVTIRSAGGEPVVLELSEALAVEAGGERQGFARVVGGPGDAGGSPQG